MTKLYFVDWDDPPYPEIRPESHPKSEFCELKTFTECKREIIEEFEWQRNDLRDRIKYWRSFRVANVEDWGSDG